jgi:hypothetical protein
MTQLAQGAIHAVRLRPGEACVRYDSGAARKLTRRIGRHETLNDADPHSCRLTRRPTTAADGTTPKLAII